MIAAGERIRQGLAQSSLRGLRSQVGGRLDSPCWDLGAALSPAVLGLGSSSQPRCAGTWEQLSDPPCWDLGAALSPAVLGLGSGAQKAGSGCGSARTAADPHPSTEVGEAFRHNVSQFRNWVKHNSEIIIAKAVGEGQLRGRSGRSLGSLQWSGAYCPTA